MEGLPCTEQQYDVIRSISEAWAVLVRMSSPRVTVEVPATKSSWQEGTQTPDHGCGPGRRVVKGGPGWGELREEAKGYSC